MIEYLTFGCTAYPVVNKINECVRALNNMEAGQQSGETPVQHGQVAICAACGNLICERIGKPAATGPHCILCGGAVPYKQQP
jgi:hypothetical protein